MSNKTVTIDVRDDIRHGREPLSKIMKAIRGLGSRQRLKLIAPFKPIPLFGLLGKKGFAHHARQVANGDWEVIFIRAGEENSAQIQANPAKIIHNERLPRSREMRFIDVDARGLEPPQPMVKILEALADLPDNAGLRACTDRRPIHLYSQLEARGFIGKSEEQNDGSFITHIWAR